MVGELERSWAHFRQPLLRACQLSREFELTWEDRLGCGIDGVVWKVRIDGRPYALKVFWDNTALDGRRYWAIQRECQNAALIQMMDAAIGSSTERPIYLKAKPMTFKDTIYNLHAFSHEGRESPKFRDHADAVAISTAPRFRKCFGWITVHGGGLYSLDPKLWPQSAMFDRVRRALRRTEEHYAILYEYIPSGDDGSVDKVNM